MKVEDDPGAVFESVLYVQEVLDEELGAKWRVDAATAPLEGGSWYFAWQP